VIFINERTAKCQSLFQNSSKERFLESISSIIPDKPDPSHLFSSTDFTRIRKLSFKQVCVFLLSSVTSNKNSGISIRLNEFIGFSRSCGLWTTVESCTSVAFCKARQKVKWEAFEKIFYDSLTVFEQLIPSKKTDLWHGKRLIAIDGSKYTLPRNKATIEEFDTKAGFEHIGKGHYPQCLVATAYDVLKKVPLAIKVVPVDTSEREIASNMIALLPEKGVIIHDRGFPSFSYQEFLRNNYNGDYLMRCPSSNTFPAVTEFIKEGGKDGIIEIMPSLEFQRTTPKETLLLTRPLKVRVIIGTSHSKEPVILLTTLIDKKEYSYKDLLDLYLKRWPVEVHFRNDKCILEVERFHGTSPNNIKQEIFSAAIVSVIARILTNTDKDNTDKEGVKARPQFKNAAMLFAMYAAVIVPDNPLIGVRLFSDVIDLIKKTKDYRHVKKREPFPRICKAPPNKWCIRNRSIFQAGGLS